MVEPRLLLLDEPSLGLSPVVIQKISESIHEINEHLKMTLLIVDQNVSKILDISHKVYIIKAGRIILEEHPEYLKDRTKLWDYF